MFNVYKNQQSRQTGSRNLMGPKTLPTIWGTYMKHVTKYPISAINSCWEKCDEICAYMFNVYKNQLSRQTGSRNLTDPKTLQACDQISDSCHQQLLRKLRRKMRIYNVCTMCIKINKVGKQEVGIWWVQKRFPRYGVPIKYQISAINCCWEKYD